MQKIDMEKLAASSLRMPPPDDPIPCVHVPSPYDEPVTFTGCDHRIEDDIIDYGEPCQFCGAEIVER